MTLQELIAKKAEVEEHMRALKRDHGMIGARTLTPKEIGVELEASCARYDAAYAELKQLKEDSIRVRDAELGKE